MKSINCIVTFIFLLTIIGCKTDKEIKNEIENKVENRDIKHIKIPKQVAGDMKESFLKVSSVLLSSNQIPVLSKYELSFNNLEKLLWIEEAEDAIYDEIRLYFVQYLVSDGLGSGTKYTDLNKFDKMPYVIYSRVLNKKEIPEYYAAFSLNKHLKIDSTDFMKMKNNYISNIREPFLDKNINKPNTDYVSIPRSELISFYGRIQLNDKLNTVQKSSGKIDVCLAEVVNFKKYKKLQKLNQIKMLEKRNYIPGQLTFIFDVNDNNNPSIPIENLSSFDMNSLCPQTCP